jgi:hypothetical protein
VSYDILLVPRRPGQSWDEALDEAEGRDVITVALGPERLEQWERIVTALRERLPGALEQHVGEDECEATHESGLQVSLYPEEAAVTFPYGERSDAEAYHAAVVDVVRLVASETGLEAWDAQADAPFDGRIHDETGQATNRRHEEQASDRSTTDAMAERALRGDTGPDTGPTAVVDPAAAAPAPTEAEPAVVTAEADLARQRRAALRYLVLGAVILVIALLLRTQGEASTLSGIAVAIGVADIVIGGFMFRAYRRRATSLAR